ncbi:hypothetical protein EKK58_09305 [Candidatus Dependentiae bacterium]|nr:MAG: hypothetical protein EKK58_09305 [Candidatus Dependentiae bacterium]
MPQLPYQSQIDPRSNRTRSEINSRVDPNAYGANIGIARQEAGDAGFRASMQGLNEYADENQRRIKEEAANQVARFDFSKTEQELKATLDPNAENYKDDYLTAYSDKVEDYVQTIEDDDIRDETRNRLNMNKLNIGAEAESYQYNVRQENSKLEANSSLSTLSNKIRTDPGNYKIYLEQGENILALRPNMDSVTKNAAKVKWGQDAAYTRFDTLLSQAKTVEALDGLAKELVSEDGDIKWTERMSADGYARTLDAIGTRRKVLTGVYSSQASAQLQSGEERSKSLTLIPDEELQSMQETVLLAEDPAQQKRMARLMRDQNIIRNNRALPPADLRTRINTANGNPGLAYPDLPPVVSSAINKAQETFGIDVGYLGGTATREYGVYMKPQKAQTNVQFKPQTASDKVNLANMRTEAVDALTFAGEKIGKPIILTPGSTGSAARISTVGMSGADKANLAGALVDSGFTGVGEYDGFMMVTFNDTIPKTFGEKDGKAWGGWSYLSPEVADMLKAKGYKPGGASSTILRDKPKGAATDIDFGKPTGIMGADGKPSSSAVGVMQFTEGTFLNLVKDPSMAVLIGVDPTGKTDAELLELRKDPTISIMAGGALAMQNKKTLQNALGRPVSNAELYMAHFMGAPGALAFINGYKNNPGQSAADLLPAAASANKPVFYDKGKALSVAEVYGNISREFSLSPTQVTFEDTQTMKNILEQTEKELANDPMSHAAAVGSHVISPITDEGGFANRGKQAMAVAEYYGLPVSDMKPFTEDEANYLKKQLDKGDDDVTLGVMAQIQSMGRDPARAAMKQLESKDRVFAHAGDLYLEGKPDIAGSIIRGRNKLIQNPALKNQLGIGDNAVVDTSFVAATGGALANIPESQAIQDAALAYWIQQTTGNGSMRTFNDKQYGQAVQAVLGGSEGRPAVDDVNGKLTWLPKDTSATTLETAIQNMDIKDWTKFSETGEAPRYLDGKIVNPDDIKYELTLMSIGGGRYKVLLDDGTTLTTGKVTDMGRSQDYIFVADSKEIEKISKRPNPQREAMDAARSNPMFYFYR